MIRRTITTTRTLGQSIRKILLLVLSGTLLYGGYRGVGHLFHRWSLHDRAEEVQQVLATGDDERAAQLLTEYRSKGEVGAADAKELEQAIAEHQRKEQQQALTAPFDAAVAKYDFPTAAAELERLRQSLDVAQRADLEQRLSGITDEGLFQRILAAAPGTRDALLRDYLRNHPQGTHRSTVAAYAIVENWGTLSTALEQRAPIVGITNRMNTLTELCTTYGAEATPLPSTMRPEKFEVAAKGYLTSGSVAPSGTFSIGDRVSIQRVDIAKIRYSDTYLEERNRNFPPGSIGYVVGVGDDFEKSLYVEFPNVKAVWRGAWDYVPEDLRKPNVGAYQREVEITLLPRFTDVEQGLFQLELERLLTVAKPLFPATPLPSAGVVSELQLSVTPDETSPARQFEDTR